MLEPLEDIITITKIIIIVIITFIIICIMEMGTEMEGLPHQEISVLNSLLTDTIPLPQTVALVFILHKPRRRSWRDYDIIPMTT